MKVRDAIVGLYGWCGEGERGFTSLGKVRKARKGRGTLLFFFFSLLNLYGGAFFFPHSLFRVGKGLAKIGPGWGLGVCGTSNKCYCWSIINTTGLLNSPRTHVSSYINCTSSKGNFIFTPNTRQLTQFTS